ncbi:MAG: SRPBCC domain-containing protein [Bacteroidetes bacterium]|nr:SRPBCC domain-containing protein [Bacteroidota bacterium]
MNKELTVTRILKIKATPAQIWEAITNPEIVKQYFFGTTVLSDWKVGSPIIFQGEWEGKKYRDKGIILAIEAEKHLHYNYWSGFSGLEDKEENYSLITYRLDKKEEHTLLTLTQKGFANEQAKEHSEGGWKMVLDGMKALIEK